MTEEERFIDIEKTRLSLGMLPIAIVRQMKAGDIKRAERAKQRANTRGSAVPEPLEINDDTDENDNDNDNREDDLFSHNSNDDPDKGGYRDPDGNDPGDNIDPDDDYTQSTNDEQTKKKNSSKRKPPQVPSGFPVMLTGHAQKHLKKEGCRCSVHNRRRTHNRQVHGARWFGLYR